MAEVGSEAGPFRLRARLSDKQLVGQHTGGLLSDALSAREMEVSQALSKGYGYNQIAAGLNISLGTVRACIFSFSSLGWSPIGAGTNTTVRVLDLGSQLNLLADGKLNLAVAGDVGIDWEMLEYQVAPAQLLCTISIQRVADAYVWKGSNAGNNFGTTTTLRIKAGSASVQRHAYLRGNLAGCPTNMLQARVRLTPVSVGTNGYEHGVTMATNNAWDESTINRTNQPSGGKRFAT